MIFNVVLLLPCFLIRYFAAVIYSGKSFFVVVTFREKKNGVHRVFVFDSGGLLPEKGRRVGSECTG